MSSKRKEEIKRIELVNEKQSLISNQIIPIDTKEANFKMLMEIYDKARKNVEQLINAIKQETKNKYEYDLINSVTSRIKSPQSILNKMKRKKYELNYRNMINLIDDIAGVRIVCELKSDIKKIRKILRKMPGITVIEEKDYIKKPKKSGYSAYHLVVETPVNYNGHNIVVKVEIQIRTMAMDYWATVEHKMRYKSKAKISFFDSKKLSLYAKILNSMDNKIMQIYRKQTREIVKQKKD